MRVLHVIKNFDCGGAEDYLCELANCLDSRGNRIYIIGGSGRQQTRLNGGISFIPLRLRDWLFLINILRVCFYVAHYKIQIIHAHQRYPILIASIVGKITGIPVVVTVHGRSQYDLRSWISRRYPKKIIFVSRFVMKASRRFPEIQRKIVFVPNGVPILEKKLLKNEAQICYVCRIDKKHASVILLMIKEVLPRLIANYPRVTFNIIGGGDLLPVVMDEAARFNEKFKKNVCMVKGFQPNVTGRIRNSALVLGVGRVALEAMACGIPVLSVNKNHLGALISKENYPFYKANNFVAVGHNPPNPDALLSRLEDFFSDVRHWQNEANILHEYVDKEFSNLRIADRIESIYKELTTS